MLKSFWMRFSSLILLGIFLAPAIALSQQGLQTPLEKIGYTRVSLSAEMSAFFQALVLQDKGVSIEILGKSVQGKPIEALVFTSKPSLRQAERRIKVMIIGTQHGAAEPAGGEAMLVMARDLVSGDLRKLRDSMDIILIPNANPDGRDLLRRSNANMININTDFVQVTQPETLALKQALIRFRPDALLDSHESAILKRQTLAKQGYLTDFYAQFESANNPAVPASARAFAFDVLLPAMLTRVTRQGLPAHRYIGEITSIHQPITHGGLTLQNFRNMAGITGTLSFLVETKLDSRDDTFATYRNIAERIERQLICLRSFLVVVHENQTEVIQQVEMLRATMPTEPLPLKSGYTKNSEHPDIAIALRKLDTRKLETRIFSDHRKIEISDITAMPKYLALTRHIETLKPYLEKHQIAYQQLQSPQTVFAQANRYAPAQHFAEGATLITSTNKQLGLNPGALLIDISQPLGRMAMLLLDPRSTSNVFRYPAYSPLLRSGEEFFIYPVP